MAFTEFYCDISTGSNVNAGDDKTVVTSTNGDWGNAAANRFTAAAGTPFSGVSVGDYASIYLDGATLAVYIARVTAVNAGGASLALSTTAKSGTAPATGATGRTCTVGGKWKGPNAAEGFPFGFVTAAQTNTAGNTIRVNFRNTSTYSVTAAITHSLAGPIRWQGYTSTVGDGGRFIIDGGTSGASYTILTMSGSGGHELDHCILQNNGATGSATGCLLNGNYSRALSGVFNNIRGHGLSLTGTFASAIECEAYLCNQSNTAHLGGFQGGTDGVNLKRCISHDHTAGSNCDGFVLGNFGVILDECVVDTVSGNGLYVNTNGRVTISNMDFYSSTLSAILFASGSSSSTLYVENSNFIKNGRYGIEQTGTGSTIITLRNCGYGAGTQVNTLGDSSIQATAALDESGKVTYASNATPWVDPANGDFRITLSAAKGAGRGTFTQTSASYTGTVGYPAIGAGQQDSGGGGFVPSQQLIGVEGVYVG